LNDSQQTKRDYYGKIEKSWYLVIVREIGARINIDMGVLKGGGMMRVDFSLGVSKECCSAIFRGIIEEADS